MKLFKIVSIITFILFSIIPSFGNDREKITFDAPRNPECTIGISGFFSKSGIAEPNDTIFSYLYENKRSPLAIYYLNQYNFLGRTGEKTFEIKYVTGGTVAPKTSEKINMYFEDNDLYPLKIIMLNTNCSKDDKIFLKMLKLQGNKLGYQIILPDCLISK